MGNSQVVYYYYYNASSLALVVWSVGLWVFGVFVGLRGLGVFWAEPVYGGVCADFGWFLGRIRGKCMSLLVEGNC